jgi:uncharacterized protein YndB with AHSA1/START domain
MLPLAAATLASYWFAVRPRMMRWGATGDEVGAPLPGDALLKDPPLDSTRAITIDAPPSAVWPWLVQIGQHRAGFYSYSVLENLAGAKIRNADSIVSEWQHIAPGDRVWLHPRVSLRVLDVVPNHAIVLSEAWAFVLLPIDGGARTRLVVRSRGTYALPNLRFAPLNFLYWRGIYEPAHFIMERGMLRGIKHRAERAWRDRGDEAAADPAASART